MRSRLGNSMHWLVEHTTRGLVFALMALSADVIPSRAPKMGGCGCRGASEDDGYEPRPRPWREHVEVVESITFEGESVRDAELDEVVRQATGVAERLSGSKSLRPKSLAVSTNLTSRVNLIDGAPVELRFVQVDAERAGESVRERDIRVISVPHCHEMQSHPVVACLEATFVNEWSERKKSQPPSCSMSAARHAVQDAKPASISWSPEEQRWLAVVTGEGASERYLDGSCRQVAASGTLTASPRGSPTSSAIAGSAGFSCCGMLKGKDRSICSSMSANVQSGKAGRLEALASLNAATKGASGRAGCR